MKNRSAVYLLLAANSISGFSQGISIIAIPWYFANVLGEPSLFGMVYLAVTFISLFWGLYAGSLIDKYNRKNIYIALSAVGAVISLIAAIGGYNAGGVSSPWIILAFATTFLIFNIHYPNLYAFAQEITEPRHYSKITSYIEIQGQATNALAGATAAILLEGTSSGQLSLFGYSLPTSLQIDAWELHEIFLLDACTYVLAILLILMIKYTSVSRRQNHDGGVVERVKDGVSFLKFNPLLFLFGVASYAVFISILTGNFYLMPIYISNHLNAGASVYASFEMFFALGSLFAGIAITVLFRRSTTVMAIVTLSLSSAMIYFFWVQNFSVFYFYLSAVLLGLSNAGVRIMRVVYIFRHVPNYIIGRISSVFNVVSVLFRMFFLLILTREFFIIDNQIVYAYLILGIFTLLGALILIKNYNKLIKMEIKEIPGKEIV